MQKRLDGNFQIPQTNVSRVGRDVYFSGSIDEDSVHELIRTLAELEAEDNETASQGNVENTLIDILETLGKETCKINKEDLKVIEEIGNKYRASSVGNSFDRLPIHLHISSRGGDLEESIGVTEFIRNMKTPVWAYTYKAYSGAFLIFVACDRRFMYQNGTLLYHQLTTGTYGKLVDLIDDVNESIRLQEVMENIVLDCTGISEDKLEEIKMLKQDWILTAEEAVTWKIVDEII
jgi:ATP-dependent protease ClpP protease subunit